MVRKPVGLGGRIQAGSPMTHRPWTPAEQRILCDLYPDATCADIAALLDRKPGSIYAKAAALGLCKSEAFKASDSTGRIQRGKQDPRMTATCFKVGMVPWNKGHSYHSGGRSATTQFKKGQLQGAASRRYKPIGSLRINGDGHLEHKITDNPDVYPARRWVPVYRLVWQAAHGPIPKGHAVVFKPGRKTAVLEAITPDKLECISRAELLRRNSVWTRSPELGRLVQLKGAITRAVRRIEQRAPVIHQTATRIT